jgi:hypothetical protein
MAVSCSFVASVVGIAAVVVFFGSFAAFFAGIEVRGKLVIK